MGKIIRLETSRKKHKPAGSREGAACEHREVTAYTAYRTTVRCTICGLELDPFDVLVDMLKEHAPASPAGREETKLLREVKKREAEKKGKGDPAIRDSGKR